MAVSEHKKNCKFDVSVSRFYVAMTSQLCMAMFHAVVVKVIIDLAYGYGFPGCKSNFSISMYEQYSRYTLSTINNQSIIITSGI